MQHSFDFAMLLGGKYHDWLISGFLLSIRLLLAALVLSLLVAVVIAVMRLSDWMPLRVAGAAYVESIRNIPLLAHMLFWYFGAPEVLPAVVRKWLYSQNIEMMSALIALVLYTSAYMAEDIRSGIRSIPSQQMEAGRSLGFSFLRTMHLVILPQSLRLVVPPLISQTLNLWKNTSIAMVIGVAEMMFQASQVESLTFRGFEPYAFATAGYIALSMLITLCSHAYERRYPLRGA
ncbi:amino acid ABC transporter permease [Castellaniella sp.]|uniref:amino acid ABC transporter permease n=1 Tax=Castellaniella sp. TaxID=1955812 RepID=UPI002AFE1CFE|nr:amino acid ABC transporter permease [Castellaniella sp.]